MLTQVLEFGRLHSCRSPLVIQIIQIQVGPLPVFLLIRAYLTRAQQFKNTLVPISKLYRVNSTLVSPQAVLIQNIQYKILLRVKERIAWEPFCSGFWIQRCVSFMVNCRSLVLQRFLVSYFGSDRIGITMSCILWMLPIHPSWCFPLTHSQYGS